MDFSSNGNHFKKTLVHLLSYIQLERDLLRTQELLTVDDLELLLSAEQALLLISPTTAPYPPCYIYIYRLTDDHHELLRFLAHLDSGHFSLIVSSSIQIRKNFAAPFWQFKFFFRHLTIR